jgi:hypothetical protein
MTGTSVALAGRAGKAGYLKEIISTPLISADFRCAPDTVLSSLAVPRGGWGKNTRNQRSRRSWLGIVDFSVDSEAGCATGRLSNQRIHPNRVQY